MKNKKFGGLTAATNIYNMIDPPVLRSIISETPVESIARDQAKTVSQCIGTTAISPLATTAICQTVGAGQIASVIDSLGARTNFGVSSILDIGLSAMDFPHQTHRQELFLQTSFPVDLAVRAQESFQIMMANPLISTISHAQTFGSESLGLIRDIVCGFNSWEFGVQLSPLFDIAGLDFDDEEFLREHQEECCAILLDMRWCPTALLSLSLRGVIRLSDIVGETMEEEVRKKAVNQLIFQELGKDYIVMTCEAWSSMDIPSHLRRLLKETLGAYRRREHGIVVSVLPTLWEGIIREKCKIEKKISGNTIGKLLQKLSEKEEYAKATMEFFEQFVMYNCTRREQVKVDVPGRHAAAHGWFVGYPTRKAALNAILFTDFLLNIDQYSVNTK